MSRRTLQITPPVYDYLLDVSLREPEAMRKLREATLAHPFANMQTAPEQAQFMAMLIRLSGARRALEIGTFTGYSALAVALALPEEGRLIACDVNADWVAMGQPFWQEAGVAGKIDLRIAPALETLQQLMAEKRHGEFDFAFIDADKQNYIPYFEACMQLIRPGGLIAVDNVLWDGKVADESVTDPTTRAIRRFNDAISQRNDIELSMIPIGDGVTLARKIPM